MTISEPKELGRFFAFPPDAKSGSVLPYWIAAGGVYARMSAASKRAFCALLEAVVERAAMPTLTDVNWPGDLTDLDDVGPGLGRFGLSAIPSGLSTSGGRASIASAFARGCPDEYWRALILSAFSVSFWPSSLRMQLSWPNDVTVMPFAVGDISGWTDGFVDSRAIDVEVPALLCEMGWTDDDREANPIYSGARQIQPTAVQGVLDEMLRAVGSEFHRIGVPSADECDLGDELKRHAELRARYYADGIRNWWTPPRAAVIESGPTDITRRRSTVAYGVAQLLLSMCAWSFARFQYELDFLRTSRSRTTTYALALEGGTLKAIKVGETVDRTETSHASTILFSRGRTLGGVVARLGVRARHPNSADSPLARTEDELKAINPRWPLGFADVEIGSASSIIESTDEGESGELICSCSTVNSSVGGSADCMGVWPHPAADEYVQTCGAVLVDGIVDEIEMEDAGGREARGSVQSVRTVSFDGSAAGIRRAVASHASWLLANCGISGVELPDEVTPDNSYLARYGAERASHVVVSYNAYSSPTVVKDGVTYYLPVMIYFRPEVFSTFTLVEGDQWEAVGEMVYAPDPAETWRNQIAVGEQLTHTYGGGLGRVRWAWHAMPTADA